MEHPCQTLVAVCPFHKQRDSYSLLNVKDILVLSPVRALFFFL